MEIEVIIDKLFETMLNESKRDLTDSQKHKLKYACKKAILENPNLEFTDLKTAAKIYLNFIISFPEIDLGGINYPIEN